MIMSYCWERSEAGRSNPTAMGRRTRRPAISIEFFTLGRAGELLIAGERKHWLDVDRNRIQLIEHFLYWRTHDAVRVKQGLCSAIISAGLEHHDYSGEFLHCIPDLLESYHERAVRFVQLERAFVREKIQLQCRSLAVRLIDPEADGAEHACKI